MAYYRDNLTFFILILYIIMFYINVSDNLCPWEENTD
jgi:hypothetical protein